MASHGLTPAQLEIIRHILRPFAEEIETVGLFGSRATGTYRPESDIDLVIYGAVSEATLARLHRLFQESALPFTVDIQGYEHIAYPPLKEHIDRVMKPLFTPSDLRV
jgi:predicted nucleotidyltransferase